MTNKCHTCKHARVMPGLKLHVFCSVVDEGSIQGSFTPACSEYEMDPKRKYIGWGVDKKLGNKQRRRRAEEK